VNAAVQEDCLLRAPQPATLCGEMTMNILWGLLTAAIGLFMLVCGTTQSEFVVYRLLAARSKILWGDAVHRFFQVSGLIVMVLGILWAMGLIWTK
jgi:hypothetical protein